MKISKLLIEILVGITLIIGVVLIVELFYNFKIQEDFYDLMKKIMLSFLIVGILISNSFKGSIKSNRIVKVFSKPLATLGINIVIIIMMALLLNKLVSTGLEEGKQLYNQIAAILLGLASLGLFVSMHVQNIKQQSA